MKTIGGPNTGNKSQRSTLKNLDDANDDDME